MDNIQRAIEILKRNKPTSDPRLCGKELCNACDVAISAMQELQQYRQIGTVEECREAIEKRKPVPAKRRNSLYVECKCGALIAPYNKYCPECGQALEIRGRWKNDADIREDIAGD